ncbi:hypothetical protein [Streptacidiphilus jiangxiensis]|uniref:Tat pathway signal sequence domain protein n=1 Tax=Streptacidiphilus jiangxiensis TaxID=235985 RepID=A0A1H7SI10_STRJI|nr:hypothetical protein [Streptacidiphilus jiangxiensis]SEL72272.1 hypothetical protein SAMN05414137_11226 [Streptacidiphilus jiangxiensis]
MAGESGAWRVEILESNDRDPRSPRRWWRRQSRRRRLALVGLALLIALAAALARFLTLPRPVPPAPTLWPALHSTVTYDGSVARGQGSTGFVITVRDEDVAAVTVTQIHFSDAGLTLRTEPSLPIQVQPGQSRRIQLIATATDCSRIPTNDELPFIDVTFRNIRAIGQESEILGDRYTADLHQSMTAACRRA